MLRSYIEQQCNTRFALYIYNQMSCISVSNYCLHVVDVPEKNKVTMNYKSATLSWHPVTRVTGLNW